jgi:uncharacterized membrane protein (UPF0127 family)
MPWLVRGDDVLASAEVAVTRKLRRRGLIGREEPAGVLVLRPCRMVHTFGLNYPIDVAFCDREGYVLHISRLGPGRVSRVVVRAYFAIEATEGAFDRWEIGPGDIVEVKG